jgi:hypothetical protein
MMKVEGMEWMEKNLTLTISAMHQGMSKHVGKSALSMKSLTAAMFDWGAAFERFLQTCFLGGRPGP